MCCIGCILFDGAPFLGDTTTCQACNTQGWEVGCPSLDHFFGKGIHVQLCGEDWGDGHPGASMCCIDDCESVWISHDSTYQWGSAEGYAEGTGG
jgi:hypothetical protein